MVVRVACRQTQAIVDENCRSIMSRSRMPKVYVSPGCQHHNGCEVCRGNRLHAVRRNELVAEEKLEDCSNIIAEELMRPKEWRPLTEDERQENLSNNLDVLCDHD